MLQKNFPSQSREHLINTIDDFCYRYTDGHFTEKCIRIAKRLSLSGSSFLSVCPAEEAAAGIIYTAGEDEYGNEQLSDIVSGEYGLRFICDFYNTADYAVYGNYRAIKKILGIDEAHPRGTLDYSNPWPVIRIVCMGSAGIKKFYKLREYFKEDTFVCISDEKYDLDCLDGCNKVLLSEGSNGVIVQECTKRIGKIARESDIIFILLDPANIDALNGQAIGAFTESGSLNITAMLSSSDPYSLASELISNGMDASLELQKSDKVCDLLSDTIKTICSFPVYEDGFSDVDFFGVKSLLKNSGAIKTVTAACSGPGRAVNAARKCTSGVQISNLKGIILHAAGPIDLGLSEVHNAYKYLKDICGGLPVLHKSSTNEFESGEVIMTAVFVYNS